MEIAVPRPTAQPGGIGSSPKAAIRPKFFGKLRGAHVLLSDQMLRDLGDEGLYANLDWLCRKPLHQNSAAAHAEIAMTLRERTMKFYYASGTCALGIHIILEESGVPYEPKAISFAEQEQYGDAFKAINPKSKVPALVRDDGSVLTEFPAIAMWLAKTAKGVKLVPDDIDGEIRSLEAMDYIVATIHMQGYGRLFRPGNFSPEESHHDKVKARGREIVEKGFSLLDKQLAGKDYLLGAFSIADAALFYVEFWAKARLSLPLPANCERHYHTMRVRPAVLAALKAEGFE